MGADRVIRIMCPNLKCRSILGVPPEARGKLVRCRKCGTNIQIPAKQEAAPPPAPKETTEAAKAQGEGEGEGAAQKAA
jgi:hypothetical protein